MGLALLLEIVRSLLGSLGATSQGEGAPSTGLPPAPMRSPEVEAALFARVFAHVLGVEGGYSEDPYDPGGPTNLGITLAEFARWRKVALGSENFSALKAELRQLSREEAQSIYRANYWDAACCSLLPAGIAAFHFDCAVNQGVGAASRMLQQAVSVAVDGAIGPITIAAARSASAATVLSRYADARRSHYRSLSTFWRFGRGWLSRVDTTLALARTVAADPAFTPTKEHSMSDATTPSQTTTSEPATQTSEAKWWGQSMTIWGVIITGLSTVLPVVGPLFGINITAPLVQQLGDAIVQFGQAGAGLVGLALTIWGRVRAVQPLVRKDVTLTL